MILDYINRKRNMVEVYDIFNEKSPEREPISKILHKVNEIGIARDALLGMDENPIVQLQLELTTMRSIVVLCRKEKKL